MTDVTDIAVSDDQVPLSEIHLDWDEFRSLSRLDREAFLEFVERMYKSNWFGRNGRPEGVPWACIDLSEYPSFPQFVGSLKKVGKSFYEVRKAEDRGYYSQFFDERTFVSDIVEINTSARERQGRPMPPIYMQTVEQKGGYPEEFAEPTPPVQAVYWQRYFGVFRDCPGHRQGSLAVDKQLVAYVAVHRYGDFAYYHTILGHKDHLRDGIVHKMHFDFVRTVSDARNQAHSDLVTDTSLIGLRFICYNGYYGVGQPATGITLWKKNNLFRPLYFSFNAEPALGVSGAGREEEGRYSAPSQRQSGNRMVRTGDYDAFAKWELLCRHWNSEPLPDFAVDESGQHRLSKWHSLAVSAGTDAVYEYFRGKGDALISQVGSDELPSDDLPIVGEVSIAHERAELWKLSNSGLNGIVGQFIDHIIQDGFFAASSDRFSPALVRRLKHVYQTAVIDRLQWTDEPDEIPTVEILRTHSSLGFPADMVRGKRKVLCISPSNQYGRRDLIHIHDACPGNLTLIDNNEMSMEEIKLIYPDNWTYVIEDERRFLENALERGETYDLIVFNVSAARAREVGLYELPMIMKICSDKIITNYTDEMLDELNVGYYEFRRLSDVVTKKIGIPVEFYRLNYEVRNLYWAVIGRR